MKSSFFFTVLLGLCTTLGAFASGEEEVTLKLVETSDVHGSYFPYDFIRRQPTKGSLARVSTYVNGQRKTYGDRLILVDNGDILQGQPVAYYYNYIDTASVHVNAAMLNYMGYDVATMGNHDVETGHAVFDRWVKQCRFPVLGANILDAETGEPYLPPYHIIERGGVKVAVLGIITPSIPSWLPEKLWSGLKFEDMETCARKWVKVIREKENPDVLVGLFHAGPEGNRLDNVIENGSRLVAENVPGFDVVFMGHDHVRHCGKVANVAGDSVLLVDPANTAKVVADVTVKITRKDGKVIAKSVEGKLADVSDIAVDEAFMERFRPEYEATAGFVSRKIGRISRTITTKDAYFGP